MYFIKKTQLKSEGFLQMTTDQLLDQMILNMFLIFSREIIELLLCKNYAQSHMWKLSQDVLVQSTSSFKKKKIAFYN